MEHVQPQLGGPAYEVIHGGMQWSLERGWELATSGRRSGTETWDRAHVGELTSQVWADVWADVLNRPGLPVWDSSTWPSSDE